jgi:predicted DsbA family dithiol-disulfide isomerase
MPFLLNPNMSDEGEGIKEHLVKKYGPGAASFVDDPNGRLNVMGRKVGIEFNSNRKMVNTRRAHALMEVIKIKGENDKANEFMEDLYKSYFENGEDINDENKLKEKAARYGVEETEAAFAMGENNLAAISRLDRQIKTTYGVSGVPFFMVHPASGSPPITFSGAYPAEIIAEQLEKALGT